MSDEEKKTPPEQQSEGEKETAGHREASPELPDGQEQAPNAPASAFPPDERAQSSAGGAPPRSVLDVWLGIGLLALLHLLLFIFPAAFFFIGIAQLVYVIPALIIARNRRGIMQGLLIGAGITFLLNAACFGFVFYSFN